MKTVIVDHRPDNDVCNKCCASISILSNAHQLLLLDVSGFRDVRFEWGIALRARFARGQSRAFGARLARD
jgi:hypothetical protein